MFNRNRIYPSESTWTTITSSTLPKLPQTAPEEDLVHYYITGESPLTHDKGTVSNIPSLNTNNRPWTQAYTQSKHSASLVNNIPSDPNKPTNQYNALADTTTSHHYLESVATTKYINVAPAH